MADNTPIEWTDATWNPVTGSSIVSKGCTNCYAMALAGTRLKNVESRKGLTKQVNGKHVWNGKVKFNEAELLKPLQWRRPRKIFVCAHGDLFAEGVPDEWIDKVFAVMALAPQHTFQVLTKRPERMRDYISACVDTYHASPNSMDDRFGWVCADLTASPCASSAFEDRPWPLPNVWLGTSVEDQPSADQRIPALLNTPAAIRWISAEPLLGPVDLTNLDHTGYCRKEQKSGINALWLTTVRPRIDWVVVGGESGSSARPMHPDWARALRDQCGRAGVPFLFKQWGSWGMPTDTLSALDWPYHKDADRTHWFDRNTCIRPIEDGWDDQYHSGTVRALNPGVDLFQTPEYLDQVSRCPQERCRAAGKCMGNEGRAAVTWVGKKATGRLLDGVLHDGYPEASR